MCEDVGSQIRDSNKRKSVVGVTQKSHNSESYPDVAWLPCLAPVLSESENKGWHINGLSNFKPRDLLQTKFGRKSSGNDLDVDTTMHLAGKQT